MRTSERRAVPSTAAEGIAWKNVIEISQHLRELKELGDAGPLRDAAWSSGMENGIDGIRDTIARYIYIYIIYTEYTLRHSYDVRQGTRYVLRLSTNARNDVTATRLRDYRLLCH